MPLEDLVGPNKYLDSLVREWPLGIDPFAEGDDHIRGLKNALLNSLPTVAGPIYPVTHVLPPNGESESTAGATQLAAGTTAQRVAAPVSGQIRYNSDLSYLEQYVNGSGWIPVDTVGSLEGGNEGEVPTLRSGTIEYQPPVARGYIDGFQMSLQSSAILRMEPGVCLASSNDYAVTLAAALTKDADGAWVEGDLQAGNFLGTSSQVDTSYHVCLITKDSDGTVDWGYDTDPNGANAPAGWTFRRRVFSIRTQRTTNNFPGFLHRGDRVMFTGLDEQSLPQEMANTGSGNRTPSLEDVNRIPLGVELELWGSIHIKKGSSTAVLIGAYSYNVDRANSDPVCYTNYLAIFSNPTDVYVTTEFSGAVCNTSGQLRFIRGSNNVDPRICVRGYVDMRGKDAV